MSVLTILAGLAMLQQPPKIDSLRLQLSIPLEEAYQQVAAALTASGLNITNSTPILIEADDGETSNFLVGGSFRPIVRAVVLRNGGGTVIQLTGVIASEVGGRSLLVGAQQQFRSQVRISNQSKGHAARTWGKLVAVAVSLDSTQVPVSARLPEQRAATTAATMIDTGFSLVGSMRQRRVFPIGCRKALKLPSDDQVYIANLYQAEQMGFSPGDTIGC